MDAKKNSDAKPSGLNYETILIATYGRSGSTLLQGILNSIDGVLIKGENGNIFHHFHLAYQELLLNQLRHPNAKLPINPWHGSCWFDRSQYLKDTRQLATNILINHASIDRQSIRAIGFKEIRYATMEDPVSYLQFLEEVFPASCVIHLTRDHQEVAQSQLRKFKIQQFDPSVIDSKLQEFDELMSAYGALKSNYFRIDFRDLTGPDMSELQRLYSFLGAEYSQATVKLIAQVRHSY